MKLTYNELKAEIDKIEQPAQRLGIFNVEINNKGKHYYFMCLKQSAGSDIGFSLNHYGWMGLPKQNYKRSKFHDEEDVCVYIPENEFIESEKKDNEFIIKTKTFKATVTY
jgi:hypothetical protein